MRILAIDPGLVTGVAYWDDDWDAPLTYEVEGGRLNFATWMGWMNMLDPEPDFVVIEDWQVRPNTHKLTPQPDPYLIIGWVELECHLRDIPFEKIQPSTHKAFNGKGAKSKVRRLGWGQKTKDNHDEDACSLLLIALRRHNKPVFAGLMEGIIND